VPICTLVRWALCLICLQLPTYAPPSVTLQPEPGDTEKVRHSLLVVLLPALYAVMCFELTDQQTFIHYKACICSIIYLQSVMLGCRSLSLAVDDGVVLSQSNTDELLPITEYDDMNRKC